MGTEHSGRVVDVQRDTAGTTIILRAGGVFRSFTLRERSEVSLGALVRVRADDTGNVLALERLGEPRTPWDPLGDGLRWSRPGQSRRAENLRRRQEIIRAIREDLYEHGFLEFETPLLVPGTTPDAHLASVETTDGQYLVTSTEYQLKRLVTGGFDRVFTLTKNFRAGDRGRFHSPEFTMLEWARAWETLAVIEDDAERFIRRAFRTVGDSAATITINGHEVAIGGERWERVTLREALGRYLGVRVDETFSLISMVRGADEARLQVPAGFRTDAHLVISVLLDELQRHLGFPRPTFLRAWPAFMTSSAELSAENPAIAERSELYIGGIEVSDGFPFLRDPVLQRESFARESRRREELGMRSVRVDERYLAAVDQGLPPGAGMALGVDRLAMALVGASEIADVLPFSVEEL
jgi:lysyl-tRNA synthetase class 2